MLNLFFIKGLKVEKISENEPTIKIIIKLISLIQKIKPKQIEIKNKFLLLSLSFKYLKI